MKFSAKFTYVRDDADGWVPEGYQNVDPIDGLGVAHDTLEHFENYDGSINGEFEALGSILFVRDFDTYNEHYVGNFRDNITDVLTREIIGILAKEYTNLGIRSCPKYTEEFSKKLLKEHSGDIETAEDYIEIIHDKVMSWVDEEPIDDNGDFIDFGGDREVVSESIKNCMILGFCKSIKRYEGIPSYDIVELFVKIRDFVNNIKEKEEGKSLLIVVDTDKRICKLTVSDYDLNDYVLVNETKSGILNDLVEEEGYDRSDPDLAHIVNERFIEYFAEEETIDF